MDKNELARALIKAFGNVLYSLEELEIKPRNTLLDPKRMFVKLNVNNYGLLERVIVEYMNPNNQNPMGIQKVGTYDKRLECLIQEFIDFENL